jgi:hypothetical protein
MEDFDQHKIGTDLLIYLAMFDLEMPKFEKQ